MGACLVRFLWGDLLSGGQLLLGDLLSGGLIFIGGPSTLGNPFGRGGRISFWTTTGLGFTVLLFQDFKC